MREKKGENRIVIFLYSKMQSSVCVCVFGYKSVGKNKSTCVCVCVLGKKSRSNHCTMFYFLLLVRIAASPQTPRRTLENPLTSNFHIFLWFLIFLYLSTAKGREKKM